MEELYIKKEECCGCGACVDACGQGAVRMVVDREGFRYPKVNSELCIDCGRCGRVCPLKKEGLKSAGQEPVRWYFGVQAKEEKTRYHSSSGGMFPVLAEYVLKRQGVVFGAAYGKNMKVVHLEISDKEELDRVKRTKYVQSSLKGVFRRVEQRLEEDRWVLFCGTPCQAQGLRLYLNRFYSRLILADLVCYGAPSPGIWGAYVRHLERRRGGRMTEFRFRDKRKADNGHTRSYVIGGKEYADSLYRDRYCRMYFSNHILRPSCYDCKFCNTARDSDFTLGDFWGVEKVKPEADDGMGTSMVIVHTEQGRRIWAEVEKDLSWFECKEEDVLQPRLVCPTGRPGSRKAFMAFYRMLPFGVFQAGYGALAQARTLNGSIRYTKGGRLWQRCSGI